MLNSQLSRTRTIICLAAATFVGACGIWKEHWGAHSRKAVEQAVQDHLRQNRSLISANFDTVFESVDFKDDTANALVKFQSKQSEQLFVEVRYDLKFESGQWEVASSTPMSGQGGDSHRMDQQGVSTPDARPATTPGTPSDAPPLEPSH